MIPNFGFFFIFFIFFYFFIFLFFFNLFLNPKLKKKMGSIPPGPSGQGVVVLLAKYPGQNHKTKVPVNLGMYFLPFYSGLCEGNANGLKPINGRVSPKALRPKWWLKKSVLQAINPT